MNHTCTAPIEENDLRLLLVIRRVTVKWETAKTCIFWIKTWKWHQNRKKICSGNPTFFRSVTWNPLYPFSISWHYPFNSSPTPTGDLFLWSPFPSLNPLCAPPPRSATVWYFYGSILLRALKSKITVVLTYVSENNVKLINIWKFYFEDVQF